MEKRIFLNIGNEEEEEEDEGINHEDRNIHVAILEVVSQ